MLKNLVPQSVGAILIVIGLWITPPAQAQAGFERATIQRVSQFSGKLVPRFESLRASEVNGRVGPSLDHPIRWQYKRAGLPVMVVMETRDWSKVQDPDGAEVWVFNQLLSSRPTVISQSETILRKKPSPDATGIARVSDKVVMDVQSCNANWCKVRAGRRTGWLPRTDIWGATRADPDA